MATQEVTRLMCKCERCGHPWVARRKRPPAVCPSCCSALWNEKKPRKRRKKAQPDG